MYHIIFFNLNVFWVSDVSEDVRVYTDDENKFKIEIPQGKLNNYKFGSKTIQFQFSCLNSILLVFLWLDGSEWQVGTGDGESSGFKSITAFYPTVASNSNGILTLFWLFVSSSIIIYYAK